MTDSKLPEVTVLVVGDKPLIRELLSMSLRFTRFSVLSAADDKEAFDHQVGAHLDPTVLDVMFPDMDGPTILHRLQERDAEFPALFLTTCDDVRDRIQDLMVGDDDYTTKSFSLKEIVVRIYVVLHRTRSPDADVAVLTYGDLELNGKTYDVRRVGQIVEPSLTEFRLLHYLLISTERVVSKIQILDHVQDYNWSDEVSIVESYTSYPRREIGSAEALGITDPGKIRATVPLTHVKRGISYVFRNAE